MKFYFSKRVTIICAVLALLMIRASFWQWDRHQQKQGYIRELNTRLNEPVMPTEVFVNQLGQDSIASLLHRRVHVKGTYDFSEEIVLRNRRFDDDPGVFVITPLKLENSDKVILVNRGFIPLALSAFDQRKQFQRPIEVEFTGLIKESVEPRWLAPHDPENGPDQQRLDAWLRVDIPAISKQTPYPLLPVWLEIMEGEDLAKAQEKMFETRSGRDEMLFLGARNTMIKQPITDPKREYPIAVFDTVIPPGRHLGYVYEWAFMALVTVLIAIILQLRPRRPHASK